MCCFVVRHLLHFGVVGFDEQLLGAIEGLFNIFPFAILGDDFAQLGVAFGDLLVARRIVMNLGRGKLAGHFVIARLDLLEFFEKRQICHSCDSV